MSNISCHNGGQSLLKHLLMRPFVLDSLPDSVIAADKTHLKILSTKVSKKFSFSLPSVEFSPNGKGQKIYTVKNYHKCTKLLKRLSLLFFS